jgi:hypothetical protein
MNKREFVLSGCASVLGTGAWAGVTPGAQDFGSASAPTRHAQWQSLLGAEFALQTAPLDVFRLHEIRDLGQTAGHEQFSLVFLATATRRERLAGRALLRRGDGSHVALYLEPMDNDPQSGHARCAAHFSLLT